MMQQDDVLAGKRIVIVCFGQPLMVIWVLYGDVEESQKIHLVVRAGGGVENGDVVQGDVEKSQKIVEEVNGDVDVVSEVLLGF